MGLLVPAAEESGYYPVHSYSVALHAHQLCQLEREMWMMLLLQNNGYSEGKFKFSLLGFIDSLSFGLSFVCYIYVSSVIFLSMNS